MKVQIWGCRGSIPRPNPEMARYGGNTPCIEVVASAQNNGDGCGGDGHRIIFDLGSGAFDLGQKISVEMFQQKKRLADMEKERAEKEGGGELSTSFGSPAKQQQSKFGGSILITHTHWDHIQGNYDRVFQFAQSNWPCKFLLMLYDNFSYHILMIIHFCRAPLLRAALPSTVRMGDLRSTWHSKDNSRNIEWPNAT
jgi:hypothetical protein